MEAGLTSVDCSMGVYTRTFSAAAKSETISSRHLGSEIPLI